LDKLSLRKADLVFSIVLMGLSVYVLVESFKLFINPFGRDLEKVSGDEIKASLINWIQSPGLLPAILACFLMLCAILLIVNALREGARLNFSIKAIIEKLTNLSKIREFYVVIIVTILLFGYVFFLIPFCRANLNYFYKFQGFPFMIATFIFLFIMMAISNQKTIRKMFISFLIAAIASGLITYGFGVMAMIPLP